MSDALVASKLAESVAAHRAALEARQHRDPVTARVQLLRAYDLRTEAHDLDPDHIAPAWLAEQRQTPTGRDTHTDLMAFYASQLGARGTDGQ